MTYIDGKNTGAIRMVAFGVLVYEPPVSNPLHFPGKGDLLEKEQAAVELLNLIKDEVASLAWQISFLYSGRAGGMPRRFILMGPKVSTPALCGRVKIGEGTLQEVCKRAVDYMDGVIFPETEVKTYPE